MEKIDRMMELYQETIDEIMGAEDYVKKARHAEDQENKATYLIMADQELGHAKNLENMAEKEVGEDSTLKAVWCKLKENLEEWKESTKKKIRVEQ